MTTSEEADFITKSPQASIYDRSFGDAETPSTPYLGFLATGWNPLMRFTSNYTSVGDDILEAVELQPTTSQSGLLADTDHGDGGQEELEEASPGERTRLWVTQGTQEPSHAPPTDAFLPQHHGEERYPSGKSTASAPSAAPAKHLASMLAGALQGAGAGPGAVSRHQSAASSVAMIALDEEDESGTSVSRHHSAASSIVLFLALRVARRMTVLFLALLIAWRMTVLFLALLIAWRMTVLHSVEGAF
eukprot:gene23224-28106_t